ncbi:MAG: hypothetical protein RMJ55_18535 [Roseiflexaceae bacterium]|nr:hypothetical protein [Roseiflexaceae bacterium]
MPGIHRLAIALALGLLSALLTYVRLVSADIVAADFTWVWRGTRLMISGIDPYAAIRPEGAYPYNDYLYYPLPALLLALPLAPLPGPVAGAAFMGISSGLLAWGVLRDKPAYHLLMFGSAPYVYAVLSVQWSPLITASAVLPALGFCLPAKPNLGIAVAAAYPHPLRIALALLALLVSLLLMPTWPAALFANLPSHLNYLPVLLWFGPLLALTVLFWTNSSARLILIMACMPQRLIYDQLPLWLAPRTFRQVLAMTICSWLGVFLGLALKDGIWALSCVYLAAFGCVAVQECERISRWSERFGSLRR